MLNVQTAESLTAAIESACAAGRLAVVAFFSPECYACRSMQPKLRQLAREHAGALVLLKVNGGLDGLREYCEAVGVTKIPFFHFYRGFPLRRVAAFTASMQPERLKLLRQQIEAHAAAALEDGAAVEAGGAEQPPSSVLASR